MKSMCVCSEMSCSREEYCGALRGKMENFKDIGLESRER